MLYQSYGEYVKHYMLSFRIKNVCAFPINIVSETYTYSDGGYAIGQRGIVLEDISSNLSSYPHGLSSFIEANGPLPVYLDDSDPDIAYVDWYQLPGFINDSYMGFPLNQGEEREFTVWASVFGNLDVKHYTRLRLEKIRWLPQSATDASHVQTHFIVPASDSYVTSYARFDYTNLGDGLMKNLSRKIQELSISPQRNSNIFTMRAMNQRSIR